MRKKLDLACIDENTLFERSPDFHPKRSDNGFFLENRQTGGIIEIDKTGAKILDLLPAAFNRFAIT